MSKKFVVAVDGSEHGSKALDLAITLAKASDAALTILHVVPYEPMPEGLQQYAEMEGIPPEEMSARFHYGKALGDRITAEAEERAHMAGLSHIATEVAEAPEAEATTEAEAEAPAEESTEAADEEAADEEKKGE